MSLSIPSYIKRFSARRGPEQRFEVLWQLSPPSITGVHSNEDAHGGFQRDLFTHEVEAFLLLLDGVLDGLDLNGDHGQNLHGDAIEFIEASPGA